MSNETRRVGPEIPTDLSGYPVIGNPIIGRNPSHDIAVIVQTRFFFEVWTWSSSSKKWACEDQKKTLELAQRAARGALGGCYAEHTSSLDAGH